MRAKIFGIFFILLMLLSLPAAGGKILIKISPKGNFLPSDMKEKVDIVIITTSKRGNRETKKLTSYPGKTVSFNIDENKIAEYSFHALFKGAAYFPTSSENKNNTFEIDIFPVRTEKPNIKISFAHIVFKPFTDGVSCLLSMDLLNQSVYTWKPSNENSVILVLPPTASDVSIEGSNLFSVAHGALILSSPFPPGGTHVNLSFVLPANKNRINFESELKISSGRWLILGPLGKISFSGPLITAVEEKHMPNGRAFLTATHTALPNGGKLSFTLALKTQAPSTNMDKLIVLFLLFAIVIAAILLDIRLRRQTS